MVRENPQALFDGILAAVALWAAWVPGRGMPALRLGATLLGVAALLGALRFSGLMPLPQLHQTMSMLGASVGLPLLGVSMAWPAGAVARRRRYAWIFGVALAVMCILIAMLAGVALWPSACALLAVLTMLGTSVARRQWVGVAAAACMLAALLSFVAKLSPGPLLPGDLLYIGLAAGLALYGKWAASA